ncbi:Bromodomain-like superfamily [Sesbania bispinosa]|nr:Bromodomain-like superfamily [Sesbania bispinosa]
MNFETVKGKLEKGLYENTDQFARDVRILFSNAKVFYPMKHEIHRIAMKLSALFEAKWKTLEETWKAEKEKEKPQPKPKPKENVTEATVKKRKAFSDVESLAKEAHGNLQIKKERETTRMIVEQIRRTIFIDDGLKSFEELEQLCCHSLENHSNKESPLKQILG